MIYVVEDDANLRELVVYTLGQTGFQASGFADGGAFWRRFQSESPRLVILDVMLPGEDGLSILKRLKASPSSAGIPVLMLTAKGAEYDKVTAFENGADDYMAKPAGMMEMVARVRNLLRRAGPSGKDEYRAGRVALNTARRAVTAGGAPVELTKKEFDLLAFLMKNAGTVMSRERILSNVWDFAYEGETRTVDAHIVTLRGKLGEDGKLIQTVRGVGYKVAES
ncbi:MAG: response regulator transcription factor [Clostridiales bacterium]|jgi:two-component system alkaline phosphatase synthesis response regulator PhoP|nr:response regulator transcription factor [Clostridiales bacterium]